MTHSRPLPLEVIASRLSEADRACLDTLARLRVASANQLYRLHYQALQPRSRQRALANLSRLGLIRRLDRSIGGSPSGGSTPYVYALDVRGQQLLDVGGPAGGKRQRPWTPSGPYLRHAVLVSECYVLSVEATTTGPTKLVIFDAEPACWRACPGVPGGMVKPDAYVVFRSDRYEDSYFLEADRATQSPAAIARKLAAYRQLYGQGSEQLERGVFPKVLFVVPDERRQATIQAVIDRTGNGLQLFAVITLSGLQEYLLRPIDDYSTTVTRGEMPVDGFPQQADNGR